MKEEIGINGIKNRIHSIRGLKVILDSDLAELYDVEIKQMNRAVKRNAERFPKTFMFQLTETEYDSLRCQNGTLEIGRGKHRKYLPFAFTEQGVSMLSGILKSKTAIKISIQIINAFVDMRRFIAQNGNLLVRMDYLEKRHSELELKSDKNFRKLFEAIEENSLTKKQGIFYEGQMFDAHKFVSDLIKTAKDSIILIDNYIDDSTLTLFSKRKKDVKVAIYTRNISKKLQLDLEKFNSQYPPIEIKEFKKSHDRFLIVDENLYHFGASLKDLGKKWFAFSKFDKKSIELLDKLNSF